MLCASVDGVFTSLPHYRIRNLEIRCHFSHRNKNIQHYIQQHDSCFYISQTVEVEQGIKLKPSHPYTQCIIKCTSPEHHTQISLFTYQKNPVLQE